MKFKNILIKGLMSFSVLTLYISLNINIASAQISVVVSSSSTNTATEAQLKAMFAGKQLNWPGGSTVRIADQPKSADGKSFYANFVGQKISKVRKTWTKLVLSGQASAPIKCSTSAEVKAALAKFPNAVGFIKTSDLDGSVKEIAKMGN